MSARTGFKNGLLPIFESLQAQMGAPKFPILASLRRLRADRAFRGAARSGFKRVFETTSSLAQATAAASAAGLPEPGGDAVFVSVLQRFTEAGQRLETRYRELCAEVDSLRAALQERTAEAKRLERLATLGETAAALAHEVRNPLGSLKLFLSLIRQDLQGAPQFDDLLNGMTRSIDALDNVVSNVLQFARKPSEKNGTNFGPVNLHALLQEKLEHLLPRDQTVACRVELKANPFIAGDEHALRRMFHNLILNALQAMRSHGQLEVKSSDGPRGSVVIQISDSGPGIAEQVSKNLFEPFVTTRNEGTGLGLAIVKDVIDQHSGTISAYNRPMPQKGACFEIALPRSAQPQSSK